MITIKGGSHRAEKSRKVLMMMKVAKLGWVGPVGQEQGWSKAKVGLKYEQEQEKGSSRAE